METPSSTTRVTSSNTSLAPNLAEKKMQMKPTDRPALHDITNDSPVVGIAAEKGLKTPSPSVAKTGSRALPGKTPGSGEALLRGTVKALLLQSVDEEDLEDVKVSSVESPAGFVVQGPVPVIPSAMEEGEDDETPKGLLFESPAKSVDDDCSSAWSVQVTVSSHVDEQEAEEDDDDYYYDVDESEEDDDLLAHLCNGMAQMAVGENGELPEFAGKHTRFIYNSDDEIEGEEEVGVASLLSPNVVVLKGLPLPEGKHLRFLEDDEDH